MCIRLPLRITILNYMKKRNKVLSVLFCLLSAPTFSQEVVIDRVVAVIGANIITQSQLEAQYQQYISDENSTGEKSKCKVLEEILYQKLLIAQAQRDSVTVSDNQVETELDRRMRYYVSQFGSEEKFEAFYGKSVESYKSELRDNIYDLLLAQTMQQKIVGDVKVSPSEIRDYYSQIPADSVPFVNEEIEIGQIVKKPFVTAEAKREAKEFLEKLRGRIVKGEVSFSAMAKLYSKDPGSAREGGCYPEIHRGQFVPEFEAIAFTIKENEVSQVFETDYGYHILKVLERKGETVNVCHILITPQNSDEDIQMAKNELDSIYNMIQKAAITFAEASGKYSDEEETKQNNGIISNPQTGTSRFEVSELGQFLDPSTIFNINKMKPGEITKPVLSVTKDGKPCYKLYYLKTRTEPHKANLKDDYQLIQAAAENEKRQKLVNDWIKKKISGNYVKIADEFKICKFQNHWIDQTN